MKKPWRQWRYSTYDIGTTVSIFATGLVLLFIVGPSGFPTILAAMIALAIAFLAYPWQKEKDDQNKRLEEKRNAYKKFILAIEDLENSISRKDVKSEFIHKALTAHTELSLYAPKLIIDAGWSWISALHCRALPPEKRIEIGETLYGRKIQSDGMADDTVLAAEFWMMKLMRAELLGESELEAGEALQVRYRALTKYYPYK